VVVVDALVVPVAQGDGFVQVGAAAFGVLGAVVEFAAGVGAIAAGGGAGVVVQSGGDALGLGEGAGFAAEVEGDGVAVEDGGDDPGAAGEPSGFAGGEHLPGVEVGGLQRSGEGVEVDLDQHGGGGLGVEVVGGQVFEEALVMGQF